ncbi:MAG: cadmium-translocating P-type ATPase [Armatimonadota bacterium]|nr:MAG: cadmium-translocating P-type ATPase [Armatimonadota bacterium]
MKRSVLYIAQMDCPDEERLVRARLERMEGIRQILSDLSRRRVEVTHSLADERDLLVALEPLGLGARLAVEEPEAQAVPGAPLEHRQEAGWRSWIWLAVSGACAVSAEAAAWVTGNERSLPVVALAVLALVSSGREPLIKGLRALRGFVLNINFLMTVAVAGAVVIGKWPEAAMVTFLFALAEVIEARAAGRARRAIQALVQMTPDTARVRSEQGIFAPVPVGAVRCGDLVEVRPGERIPLDGIVIEGNSAVDQSPITGESIPVEKTAGDALFAGTINGSGALVFEVTASKGSTTLDRIIRLVREAQARRAPIQRFVDRFAARYTPAVVVAAVAVASVPPLFLGAPALPWVYRALVLLVIACPCALVLATPVTIVSALTAAARCGILVKGGAHLEHGRLLKAVAFDKTGTLTEGRPRLTDVISLNGFPEEEALRLAASLNVRSEHPIASAIVAGWAQKDLPASASEEERAAREAARLAELQPAAEFEAMPGMGVRGRVDGRALLLGNHRLAETNGTCGPDVERHLEKLEAEGKTAFVLMSEDEPVAVFGVADELRPASKDAVAELRAAGLHTVLLSGDAQKTVDAIAAEAGVDEAFGGLLPEEKADLVAKLTERFGRVGMVGDGVNDAPALARAHTGFAMGAVGSDAALETADVALMEDDLRKVPEFLRISRSTHAVLWQNIAIALGIKAVFFALAVTGKATLWMAVFADMGASLIVVANGLRLLRCCRAEA